MDIFLLQTPRLLAYLMNNLHQFSKHLLFEALTNLTYPHLNKMSDFGISEEMIQQKLQELNPGKYPGPDGIHPRMLKQFSSYFAQLLWIVFRKSLVTGSVPED